MLALAVHLLVYRRSRVFCIPRSSSKNQTTKIQQAARISDRSYIPYHSNKNTYIMQSMQVN